jgi:hypothetical protein
MASLIKRLVALLVWVGVASVCHAGWLNPSQQNFVIQTYTSYEPISGNNTGTITTNGNSYQFAGDNTGTIYIGGRGSQFRGMNAGNVFLDGDGAFVLGSFGILSTVTNRGKGSLLLGNLSTGQRAVITDVGNASILIGAGTVSNSQCIVVGDGNESHGIWSVTAGSFWSMGGGFFGNGAGLTNLPVDSTRFSVADAAVLSGRVSAVESNLSGVNSNASNYLSSERTIWVATNGSDSADGRTPGKAKRSLAAGIAAVGGTNWTVIVRDGVYWLSNTVFVTNCVTLKSENGAAGCVVDGNRSNRCFDIRYGTVDGFSITGGRVVYGDGGGVYIENGTLRNCRVYGNSAEMDANGGGVCAWLGYALIENCTIYSNSAGSSGAGISLMGAGEYQTVRNCLIFGNTGWWSGGVDVGINGNSLNTFVIEGSTITGNTATGGGGIYLWNGQGLNVPMTVIIRNTISYGNSGSGNPNFVKTGTINTPVSFSCISPLVAGDGNIAVDPLFVSGSDFHLSASSPCLNAGTNLTLAAGAVDLDGNPRVSGGRTDMGAFESLAFPAVMAGSSPTFNCVTGTSFAVGSYGFLTVVSGTQLVFVVGSVTNVLDNDITHR